MAAPLLKKSLKCTENDNDALEDFVKASSVWQHIFYAVEGFYKHKKFTSEDLKDHLKTYNCEDCSVYEGAIQNIVNAIFQISNQSLDVSVIWVLYYDYEKRKSYRTFLLKVFGSESSDNAYFIDTCLKTYNSWDKFLDEPHLPHSLFCVPKNGMYKQEGTNVKLNYFINEKYKKIPNGSLYKENYVFVKNKAKNLFKDEINLKDQNVENRLVSFLGKVCIRAKKMIGVFLKLVLQHKNTILYLLGKIECIISILPGNRAVPGIACSIVRFIVTLLPDSPKNCERQTDFGITDEIVKKMFYSCMEEIKMFYSNKEDGLATEVYGTHDSIRLWISSLINQIIHLFNKFRSIYTSNFHKN